MEFFDEPDLSSELYGDIEAGRINDAIDLLISKRKKLSEDAAAKNICDAYLQSSNPKNWEMFWEAILQNSRNIPKAFIKETLVLSQKKLTVGLSK